MNGSETIFHPSYTYLMPFIVSEFCLEKSQSSLDDTETYYCSSEKFFPTLLNWHYELLGDSETSSVPTDSTVSSNPNNVFNQIQMPFLDILLFVLIISEFHSIFGTSNF